MMTVVAILVAILLGTFLVHRFVAKQTLARETPLRLFREVQRLFEDAEVTAGEAVGTWTLTGRRRGLFFQVSVITDTLATRKLPVLWLMVTLPEPQPLMQSFDLMMRASGPTTFSKFEFLPESLPLPPGFPTEALVRSERDGAYPAECVRPHVAWFQSSRGKEILLSPKGLRLVLQAAEADRARYGVLRQAEFGDVVLDAPTVEAAVDALIAMRQALAVHD